MDDYITTVYGEDCADVYDQWFGAYDEATIDTLAQLSQQGRVLELGIGTGLIALPLAARGVEVHGIDGSSAMVARLRAKPGGEAIPVTMGNFADTAVAGEFALVYIVYNTLFALLTQAEQVRCFRSVSNHLAPGGVFVVEVFVPDVALFNRGQAVNVMAVTNERVGLKVSSHDPVEQRIKSQHVVFVNNEVKLYPVEVRYAWPSELDLMAQLAGLQLKHRWSSWRQDPFKADSAKHISVYELRIEN